MANQEKPNTRKTNPGAVTINVHAGKPASPRKHTTQPETSTPAGPAEPTTKDSAETTPTMPLFRKSRNFVDAYGQKHRAGALAATAFARFQPNNYNVQPAEFAEYEDAVVKRRGYI